MDKAIFDKYEPIIGLEVHIQLLTKSKAYCSDSTEFGAMPNTQVSPISLGHPGTLPMVNKKVIEYHLENKVDLPQVFIYLRNTLMRESPKVITTTQ